MHSNNYFLKWDDSGHEVLLEDKDDGEKDEKLSKYELTKKVFNDQMWFYNKY